LSELIAVARAKNIDIPDDLGQRLLQRCRDLQLGHPLGITTSMMMDNLAGRNMEVECIIGTPLREAIKEGVKVPTLLTCVD
jgi:ketopantoate reductase